MILGYLGNAEFGNYSDMLHDQLTLCDIINIQVDLGYFNLSRLCHCFVHLWQLQYVHLLLLPVSLEYKVGMIQCNRVKGRQQNKYMDINPTSPRNRLVFCWRTSPRTRNVKVTFFP